MLRLFTTQRVAFLIVFAVIGSVTVIHDPDFYFHLVAGQYIIKHGTLPHVDVFSFTMAGAPWHMHEWLFEVWVARLFGIGGEEVIVWATAALGVWAFYLVFRAGQKGQPMTVFRLLPAMLLMIFYIPYLTQRPQVITFLSFAIYLWALFELKYRDRHRWLWLLPPVMVIWVNSHGGYLLGIAILGLFTAGEWFLWWREGRTEAKKAKLRVLGGVLITTVLASLLNPYFADHWLFPFELMGRDSMSVISEWQRPDFGESFMQGYLLCVLLFIGQYLRQRSSPDLTEWLVPGVMIIAGMTAVRHIPLAVMTLLPFFLLTLERPSRRIGLFARRDHAWKAEGGDLGLWEPVFNLFLLGAVVAVLLVFSPFLKNGQQQLKQAILPVKAVDYLEKNHISGRLFNQYRYGGYLLHRRYPEQRVFIDIRADMYGDDMMRKYSGMFFAVKGWEAVFDSYDFDAVLCERNAALVAELLKRGDFELAYRDDKNVVLVRTPAKVADLATEDIRRLPGRKRVD